MLNRFNELPYKNAIIIVTTSFAAFIFILFCILIPFLRRTNDAADENSVIKFQYCGESPQELCVLSFGHDGTGDTIINFFVPDKKIPDFYLIVKKAGEENRYECIRNTEVTTSVFCRGPALSLKQTVEIDVLASSNNELLASGRFLLEAFLVSTPNFVPTEEVTKEATEEFEIRPTTTNTSVPTPSAYPYPPDDP